MEIALFKLTEDISTGIDDKLMTLLLFYDFSKAFDTVSPSRLLAQLHLMGFSRTAFLWIRSYLAGREQLVTSKFNGASSWIGTNLGILQGSVRGRLLFCLYIKDVCDELDKSCIEHILYADDLQII